MSELSILPFHTETGDPACSQLHRKQAEVTGRS